MKIALAKSTSRQYHYCSSAFWCDAMTLLWRFLGPSPQNVRSGWVFLLLWPS